MGELKIGEEIFKIRPLRYGEVNDLRKKHGIILIDLNPGNADEARARAFEMVFTKKELKKIDELDNKDALEIWRGVLNETYGISVAEDNPAQEVKS